MNSAKGLLAWDLSKNWNKSHARRRFAEALKALPKVAQKNVKETIAYKAVSRIAVIYHLDNQMEGQPAKAEKCIVRPTSDLLWRPSLHGKKKSSLKTSFPEERLWMESTTASTRKLL